MTFKAKFDIKKVHLFPIFCNCEEDAYRAEDYISHIHICTQFFISWNPGWHYPILIYAVIFETGTYTIKRKLTWSWKRMQWVKKWDQCTPAYSLI